MWTLPRVTRRKRRRASKPSALYLANKEAARVRVHELLKKHNEYYGFTYHRVAIRDQRRRWGSCSSKGNLNFSYRILFLPLELQDYLVVHELCHLKEFHHGPTFWNLVAEQVPHYAACISALREYERAAQQRILRV